MKESVKDTASKGVEKVKDAGSKIGDKGHGKFKNFFFSFDCL